MPKLIRLYIVNVAIGFALAVVFTALLIAFDVAHLRHLVFASGSGVVAVFMLIVFHTVLFAGVQFAIAVMSMAEDGGGGSGRRFRLRHGIGSAQPIKDSIRNR
ncbi:hypothetical protein [Paracoccus albus]|uniref:hypothetical protein n=1 Tax=Paracoccus albus TaxID=3017784 RepID=UPI0022F0C5AA|nr:hypothetical protein [Paracoccus albus]WBU61354.1 hypothetical protein PAF20_05475 [Paracoccus albus]